MVGSDLKHAEREGKHGPSNKHVNKQGSVVLALGSARPPDLVFIIIGGKSKLMETRKSLAIANSSVVFSLLTTSATRLSMPGWASIPEHKLEHWFQSMLESLYIQSLFLFQVPIQIQTQIKIPFYLVKAAKGSIRL